MIEDSVDYTSPALKKYSRERKNMLWPTLISLGLFAGSIVFLGFESAKEEKIKNTVVEHYDLNEDGRIRGYREYENVFSDLEKFTGKDYSDKSTRYNFKILEYKALYEGNDLGKKSNSNLFLSYFY